MKKRDKEFGICLLILFLVVVISFVGFIVFALPTLTFVSPTLANNSYTNNNWVFVNITSDENLNQSLLEWGNSSGFTNVSMSNSSLTNWYKNMTNLADYTYNYTIWAQNTSGNWSQSARYFVTVDTINPDINFTSPTFGNGLAQSNIDIFVNVSTNDTNEHYAFVDFNNDLILWIRMDDVNQTGEGVLVYDNSSYGNNGTAKGNTTQTDSGYFGKAFEFDGNEDYIDVGNDSNLDITSDLTIELWLKKSITGKMRLITKTVSNGASNNPYDFGIDDDNKLYFVRANATAFKVVTGTRIISANEWTQVAVTVGGEGAFTDINSFSITNGDYRAWQGIATDGTYFYILTDRNETFGLENIISKYYLNSTFVEEKRNAYEPGLDDFFSFGDGEVIDNKLYVGVYNANDPNKGPLASRIAVFNLSNLSIIEDYDIGGNVVEGIDKYNDSFWVCYDDISQIKEFNASFDLRNTYDLNSPFLPSNHYYQSLSWYGNEIFVNLHGDNDLSGAWARGLDHYSFNGTAFNFIERLIPAVYGVGQGVAITGTTFYWNDRPGNKIWSSTYVGIRKGDKIDGAIKFGINGTLVFVDVITFNPTGNNNPTLIGKRDDGTSYFKGSIDEVMIFNRSLSAEEISALYNATANQYYHNFTNLTEGTYTFTGYAVDRAGNKNFTNTRTITLDTTPPTISFTCSPTSVNTGQTITCSCTATDNADSSPSVSYTTNPSTSSTGTYTTTCTAEDDAGNSASSSISYTVSSSGGGGISSGSFYKNTFVQDKKEFSEIKTITQELKEKERVRIKINDEEHHIGVAELTNTTATVEIFSTTQKAVLNIGEEKKFEVTDDDFYDIYVKLNSIENNKANLTIVSIHEQIPLEEEPVTEDVLDDIEEEEERNITWLWIVIGFVLLVVIGVGVRVKGKK